MRLIDAHKLEKEFKRIYNVAQNCQSLDWGTVKNTIRDQPEVDPAKHAHWIFYKDMGSKYIECSNCGAESGYDDEINQLWGDYCKYCGAKMDEATE